MSSKGFDAVRDFSRQRLRGHTRLSRAEFVNDVLAQARKIGADEMQAARTARHAWDSRWGRIDPEHRQKPSSEPQGSPAAQPASPIPVPIENAAVGPQEAEIDPIPVPPPQNGGRQPYSLQDLLKNADMEGGAIDMPPLPPPANPVLPEPLPPVPADQALSEATRRQAAKATVRKAVADVNRVTNEQYLLYHQAMLVKNRNVKALQEMEIAAAVEGISVQQLADRIITEWEARCRRAAYVYAVEAQALKDIDQAHGDDIDDIAHKAASTITGDTG